MRWFSLTFSLDDDCMPILASAPASNHDLCMLCSEEYIEWCLVALGAKVIFNRKNSVVGGRATIAYALGRDTRSHTQVSWLEESCAQPLTSRSFVSCIRSAGSSPRIFETRYLLCCSTLSSARLSTSLPTEDLGFHARNEKYLTDVALMPSMETKGYSLNRSSSQLRVNDI